MFANMSLSNWFTTLGGAALSVVTYASPLIPPPYNIIVSGLVSLASNLLHLNATAPADAPIIAAATKK